MARLVSPPQADIVKGWPRWRSWLNDLYRAVASPRIPAYTVATLPDPAAYADSTFTTLIYVTDESGGADLAFSDGTNWRRLIDRNIVT
jgi:hypothetical protein